MVFTAAGDMIVTIAGFPSRHIFGRFGLPATCD
jgi:hypothetical protein